MNDWVIDKWRNDDELIEFGIKEKEKVLSIEEFQQEIETSNMLLNEIENLEDSIKHNHKTKLISDIFNIEKGKSKYTKSYIHNNKGQYPDFR